MCSRIVQNAKTPVQAIKTRNTKSRKTEIFPKGLVHGHFPSFSFWQYRLIKCILRQSRKKMPFQAIKSRSPSRKIEIFPKGLIHCFGQKLAIFQSFYFRHYKPAKCLPRQCRTKKRPIFDQNHGLTPLEKSRVSPWFWAKIGHFSIFIFPAIQASKISFMIVQNAKAPFQALKTRSAKSPNNLRK